MSTQGRPCCFFDRDGIVNRDPAPKRYVESVAEFHLNAAFLDALRTATEKGYVAVLITNQKGVGTGVMTREALDAIHAELTRHVQAAGLALLDIFACTATVDTDPDRKPNPGMLLKAAERHGLDLAKSWMIGDKEGDVTAGHRAGCRAVLVAPPGKPTAAEAQAGSIDELPALLRRIL